MSAASIKAAGDAFVKEIAAETVAQIIASGYRIVDPAGVDQSAAWLLATVPR